MQVLPHTDGAPKHTGGFGSPQAFATDTSRIRVIQNLINTYKKNQTNGPKKKKKKNPEQPITLYTSSCEQLK